MRTLLTVIMLTLPLIPSTSWAEMYRWQDEKGVVTFKDYPPPVSQKNKVKVYADNDFDPAPPKQTTPNPVPAKRTVSQPVSPPVQPAQPKAERFNGTVEIYITAWCGYCKKAVAYMKSRNIPYVAYDIEKDSDAKQRHRDLGGRGVPLIIIGKNKMSGFSAEVLEYYLANK